MDLLVYLLARAPNVVATEDILKDVWAGRVVEQSVVHRHVSQIRAAFSESARSPRVIATVHRRGYRVIAEVASRPTASMPTASKPAAREPVAPELTRAEDEADDADPPFAGRHAEMSVLRTALGRLDEGRGSAVLLAGVSGIGKTTTALRFLDEARHRSVLVLDGWCEESGAMRPFWPWVSIVRQIAEGLGDRVEELRTEAALLARIAPEIFTTVEPVSDDSQDDYRLRVGDCIARILARVARISPLVVFIDDLHRADLSTLAVFEFVAREARLSPMLLLGAYRTEAGVAGPAFAATLAALWRLPGTRRVELAGLSGDELAELVARYGLDLSTVEDVLARTDGSPLYAGLMLRALADAPDGHTDGLLEELVAGRLLGLGSTTQQVVRAASVMGRTFEPSVLQEITGLDANVVQRCLGESTAASLTSRDSRFAHLAVQESVYAMLGNTERSRLHAAIAETLARLHRDSADSAHYEQIARHHQVAGADIQAARWYQRAYAVLYEVDRREAYRCCLLALAGLEAHIGAGARSERVTWLLRTLHNALVIAGTIGVSGDEAADLLQRGRRWAAAAEHAKQHSLLVTAYSDYLTYRGHSGMAARYAREALALARGCGEQDIEDQAQLTFIARQRVEGDLPGLADKLREYLAARSGDALASLGGRGVWFPHIRLQVLLAELLVAIGRPRAALEQLGKAMRLLHFDGEPPEPSEVAIRTDAAAYRGTNETLRHCVHVAIECYYYLGDMARLGACSASYADALEDVASTNRAAGHTPGLLTDLTEGFFKRVAARASALQLEFGPSAAMEACGLYARARLSPGSRLASSPPPGDESLKLDHGYFRDRLALRYGTLARVLARDPGAPAALDWYERYVEAMGTGAERPFVHFARALLADSGGDSALAQREADAARGIWIELGAQAHIAHMDAALSRSSA